MYVKDADDVSFVMCDNHIYNYTFLSWHPIALCYGSLFKPLIKMFKKIGHALLFATQLCRYFSNAW